MNILPSLLIIPYVGNTLNIDLLDHRFRNLFEEAPFSAALYAGPEFVIEMANETTLKWWRLDSSILGKPLLQAIPEMGSHPLFQILKKVYESGVVYEGRERVVLPDANGIPKKVYVNTVYKPIRDDGKNITGILAIGHDVTTQVAEKQKLEELEERARMAIESAGLGTFDLDYKTGIIITISPPKNNEEVLNPLTVRLFHADPVNVTVPSTSRWLLPMKLKFNGRIEVEFAVKFPRTVNDD